MGAPPEVLKLVERFERNRIAYESGHYNEAQVRREFIDPLLKSLGWDVDNTQGYAEAYKDVVHEDAIRVEGSPKAPDYSVRIGGTRKFFVEAKKPSVRLKTDPHPAYQLRRYAWSATLPLSVLTDFAELAVYDCRVKPEPGDGAAKARILYFTCDEYDARWDELASVFSRDAVLKGSFDTYAETVKGKRGTMEVDAAFLAEIEAWRAELARNLALRNPTLTTRELNFAVQTTIDRLVFLRICEDRGLEPYGSLSEAAGGKGVYERLMVLFRRADGRYNSGLFHFDREKGREEPDGLTPGLTIDDKTLKAIILRLYYPQSPYEFSVISADILGQVYEQFLGRVISLTPAHRVKVEDKPEVKKAGGVYYTPAHICRFIVERTLEPALDGRDAERLIGGRRRQSFRVLDPACGSGSFLIAAYQYLLDWYLAHYSATDPDKRAKGRLPRLFRGPDGEWRLTTRERKRILTDHIFGVDIDPQAVEVTKLSLLLKVLEGESDEMIQLELRLFHERALPDLANNIKCGNSLVGSDFYADVQMTLLSDEEQYRVNVFDWKHEFEHAIKSGGFDAIVGNPPWLMAGYYVGVVLPYLRAKYESATGKFDLYYTFLERACELAGEKGKVGMIVPNKLFHTKAASSLRRMLVSGRWLRDVTDFEDEQVFSGPTNYSAVLLLEKDFEGSPTYGRATRDLRVLKKFSVPWSGLGSEPWHFQDPKTRHLFKKLEAQSDPLEELVERFGTGVQSGADRLLTFQREDATERGLEHHVLRPFLRGRNVRRFGVVGEPKLLVFPYKAVGGHFETLSETELQGFPKVYEWLKENKQALAERVWFGKNAEELSGKWYGMMYVDSYKTFAGAHLLTPSLSNEANFAPSEGALFGTGTAGVTSLTFRQNVKEHPYYLLGLLNSRLLSLYVTSHSPIFSGGFYKFTGPYLSPVPIRRIDFGDSAEVALHDQIVGLVMRRIALAKEAPAASSQDKGFLERQVQAIEAQIEQVVLALYGLTPSERTLVEVLDPAEPTPALALAGRVST